MSRLKSNSRKTFLFKAFLVTILLPLIISPLHFIKVRNIECGTESDYCLENIDKYKAKYENTSLFSAKRMLEKELENEVKVDSYMVNYKPPFDISLNVRDKIVKYRIYSRDTGKIALIDVSGYVLEESDEGNNYYLIIDGVGYEVGSKIKEELFFSLRLTDDVRKRLTVSYAFFKSAHLEVGLNDGNRIIFPTNGDRKLLVGSAVFIVKNLRAADSDLGRIAGSNENIIDLRYKNPVIK